MRVLHINCNYISTKLHQNLIVKLEERGIYCEVFAPVIDSVEPIIGTRENEHISICITKFDKFHFLHKQDKILNAIEKTMDISSFDCIHAYTLFTDGYCAHRLSKKYGIPYVVAVRNTDINYFFKYRLLTRKYGVEVLRDSRRVFFLSKPYQEYLINHYVSPTFQKDLTEKSRIIANGIDDYWFQSGEGTAKTDRNNRLMDKQLVIAYAGDINKNKNLLVTIDALDKLQRKGWNIKYRFAGKIKNTRVFRKVNSRNYSCYLGVLPREKVRLLYDVSDIFIMPSHKETFGLVYAEAMSQGLPVIYTRGQGFDKWFDDGCVGWPVRSNNSDEVVAAIERIILEYDRCSNNAKNGSEKFKWDAIANEYIKIYGEILGGRR